MEKRQIEKPLSIKELSEALGVSRSTVDRHLPEWIADKILCFKVLKIGGIYRFPRSEVKKLMEYLTVERVGV
jgi:excisionase family DNA binding protein